MIRAGLVACGLMLVGPPAWAGDIISEWGQVRAPAAPELSPVTVDPASTALFVLDMNGAQNLTKGPCNAARPRCMTTIPAIAAMLNAARKQGVLVVYSVSGKGTPGDIASALAPRAADPVVKSGPDKFVGTKLAEILAKRHIATVIITGTGAEGAVLDTATDAVLREKLRVIVPVDGMSSATLYPEQYVAWHFVHAAGLAGKVTLTRGDMIAFRH